MPYYKGKYTANVYGRYNPNNRYARAKRKALLKRRYKAFKLKLAGRAGRVFWKSGGFRKAQGVYRQRFRR